MDTLPCDCNVTVDSEGFSNLDQCTEHLSLQIWIRDHIKHETEADRSCGCKVRKQMFSEIYRSNLCDEHVRYYDSVNEIYHRNNKLSGLETS